MREERNGATICGSFYIYIFLFINLFMWIGNEWRKIRYPFYTILKLNSTVPNKSSNMSFSVWEYYQGSVESAILLFEKTFYFPSIFSNIYLKYIIQFQQTLVYKNSNIEFDLIYMVSELKILNFKNWIYLSHIQFCL